MLLALSAFASKVASDRCPAVGRRESQLPVGERSWGLRASSRQREDAVEATSHQISCKGDSCRCQYLVCGWTFHKEAPR
jgi:hypothetical protein